MSGSEPVSAPARSAVIVAHADRGEAGLMGERIAAALPGAVIHYAHSAGEVVRQLRSTLASAVFSAWPLADTDLAGVVRVVNVAMGAAAPPVTVVTERCDARSVALARRAGVRGYLLAPLRPEGVRGWAERLAPELLRAGVHGELVLDQAPSVAAREALQDRLINEWRSGAIDIPAPPAVYQSIRSAIEGEESGVAVIAAMIEREPGLAGRLLGVANSSYYRGVKELRSVERALTRLGLRHVADIVLAIDQKSAFMVQNRAIAARIQNHWEASVATALAARLLARHLREGDPDALYTAGLLQGVGALAVLRAIDRQIGADETPEMAEIDALVAQLAPEFRAALLRHWRFSEGFRAIACPEAADAGGLYAEQRSLIALALAVASACKRGAQDGRESELAALAGGVHARRLGVDAEALSRLTEESARGLQELRQVIG
ncbi:HD-like signal output (HDOD) protein [Natronocella acetinitrilica]|uniref:HD-like signal output (HDOD) protein n=1 Tax=Natronocella acetinitrilica TaxID=414046 RepID=A0AAE3G365_9GAMM|nr:HDOD domain-containing protein [Natronocella acetinitrilica]MCP1674582.1 HD-like signal output (HDOD) protein [Natronocella acetinitrilica]